MGSPLPLSLALVLECIGSMVPTEWLADTFLFQGTDVIVTKEVRVKGMALPASEGLHHL